MIQGPITAEDNEGIVTQSWSDVGQVEGVMLPYGNERALRDYGFTENVKYRFFYKGNNANLKVGNRILFKDTGYPIVYVADYGKAMDVLLNTSGSS